MSTNKSKRLAVMGLAFLASSIPSFGMDNDMRQAKPNPLRSYNSNKPSKKRQKVKQARKQNNKKK